MIHSVKTDKRCMATDFRKKISAPDIPVLFDDDGIFVEPSRYLMFCALNDDLALGSVKTYADHLQAFFKYLDTLKPPVEFNKKKYSWSDITDKHFFSYIRHKKEGGRSDKYIGQVITTVFQFYRWAEETGLLKKHVAMYDDEYTYSISAQLNKNKKWVWPYTPKPEHEFQPVPTSDDLEKVHTHAMESSDAVGFRDTLIMSLMERTARRMDVLQIKVEQIPSIDEIEDALETDTIFHIEVFGKGKVTRTLKITPELAEDIRDYIDNDRADIVAKIRKKDKTYKDPGKVFISSNYGVELSPNYVSSRLSGLMKEADVKGTGHRIRAKGLTDIVASHDGYDKDGKPMRQEDVLLLASEDAGHKNPKSLQAYLARSRAEGVASRIHAAGLSRALDDKIIKQRKTLSDYAQLQPVLDAIENGDDLSDSLLELLHKINNKGSEAI
ncbi:MAG: hypothetical protein ISR69_03170 [Gammaproteobacteria bacterium]|nr:hypothetical protein [Gammaproteobacteria bacterium]